MADRTYSSGRNLPRRVTRPPLTRSEQMALVRAKDTGPEMRVRRALWRIGLRYRLHDKRLPGKPDLVFRSRKIALFVHGCFWHGHEGCARHRIPKTRTDWWRAKIERTKTRDAEVRAGLEAAGWRVLVIWECETERGERLADLAALLSARDLPRGWATFEIPAKRGFPPGGMEDRIE